MVLTLSMQTIEIPCRKFKGVGRTIGLNSSVNVFSTKVLIDRDTIFTSPNGEGMSILRGHSSNVKVWT